ncbi:transcriptional regulator, TetR family [Faunimonas pinastri]|uniref:Transcriptional regulator, TetR family n=1 Tax=Faunimonas pinastri TaxID=1855383 RepID=A0A1H9MGY1_9HYPH|nr:TetR/AcrR family transcriptional regulator [Faunimonas pinastri]SER22942.1 transcriptional regulator, TetR family [Faunimonas pinastri]
MEGIAQVARRKRLVEAAASLFAAAPYADVQVDEIARAARMAKPTVYRYFHTKEELFFAALEQDLERLAEQIRTIRSDGRTASNALACAIRAMIPAVGGFKAAVSAVEAASGGVQNRGPRLLTKRLRALRGEIAEMIEDGIATGEFRPVNSAIVAMAILGSVRMSVNNAPEDDVTETVADLLLNGLSQTSGSQPHNHGQLECE